MNVPDDLKYATSHEWAREENGVVTVGVTDHAQAELTEIVYVELPEIGKVVSAGEEVAVVESVKSASDIFSPVAGEIVEVNEATAENPAAVNDDAFGEGWLFKVKGTEGLDALLDAAGYKELIG
ncbi:MAG: glycine cleavage system H protein [Verrucomicrobiales bacterium]|jgi:glycine cleavage system H protein